MSDVFISYRRDDGGWAGRLYGELEQPFDVYFDTDRTKNDYGDRFAQGIADALAECRVALVVVGPGWCNKDNLARLDDAQDLVRREIEMALEGQPRIRVLPVLVGNGGVPDKAALPASLRPLFELNGSKLTIENWKNDCSELIDRINGWLSGQMPVGIARRSIPAYLPYLCDRVAQEESLVDFVKAAAPASPVYACIVHGHKLEFHESFLQRTRYYRLLEDLFNARDVGVAMCPLQWNRDKAREGKYAEALRRALKSAALKRPAATDADVIDYLRALAQPLAAIAQVTWSDYELCGAGLIPGLLDAWKQLFAEAANAGSSSGRAPMPSLLWINLTYDDARTTIDEEDPRLAGVLLPRLQPVTQGEIAEWLSVPEVQRATVGFEASLLGLPDDPNCCVEAGKVHMQRFVDEVRRIVVRP